jgi:hypothetical protein
MTMLARIEISARSIVRRYLPRKVDELGYDPYDKQLLERRASDLLDEMRREPGRAPLEACQCLLRIMEESYPTAEISAEYFSNLDVILSGMSRLECPGQIIIGLGPGRCGSTSLSAMLGTAANSCSTHETPPPIFWAPQREQVDFHVRRLRKLSYYHPLVSDVSHWWVNTIDQVFDSFPEAKAIGLIRNCDDCAVSFMRIQGLGKRSYNPWAPPGNRVWRVGPWDPTYPSYPLQSYARKYPDRAKRELITRYVEEYNERLESIARKFPGRVKLVATDDLSVERVQGEIFEFAQSQGATSDWKLNVKSTVDGKKNQIRF